MASIPSSRSGNAVAPVAREEPDLGGSMRATSVHVVPAGNEWALEQRGKQLSTHRTQAEAEKIARDEASRAHRELVVHGATVKSNARTASVTIRAPLRASE